MIDVNIACDYIIHRTKIEGNENLTNLRLQKLLYYTQSWYLAFTGNIFFEGEFEAWIHGPVSRDIYDRFKQTKGLYSEIEIEDIDNKHFDDALSSSEKKHIDNVLDAYMKYSDVQLELMTHREEPWIKARHGYAPTERCEVVIDKGLMRDYYKARLA